MGGGRIGAPFILGALLSFAPGWVSAQPLLDPEKLRCAELREVVRQPRPVILRSDGPHGRTKITRFEGNCDFGEASELATIRSLDISKCEIGYRCVNKYDDYDD